MKVRAYGVLYSSKYCGSVDNICIIITYDGFLCTYDTNICGVPASIEYLVVKVYAAELSKLNIYNHVSYVFWGRNSQLTCVDITWNGKDGYYRSQPFYQEIIELRRGIWN
jgi:hypothetical protein